MCSSLNTPWRWTHVCPIRAHLHALLDRLKNDYQPRLNCFRMFTTARGHRGQFAVVRTRNTHSRDRKYRLYYAALPLLSPWNDSIFDTRINIDFSPLAGEDDSTLHSPVHPASPVLRLLIRSPRGIPCVPMLICAHRGQRELNY